MSKEIYISSTPHETRLAIVEKDELTEIYYERENEYTLAGSIYNGRVTRVLPGMQSSFVDIGLERDAFLYITDFMEEQGDTADFDSGEARHGNGRRESRDRNRSRREATSREDDGGELGAGGPVAQGGEREERSERYERNGSRDRRRSGSGPAESPSAPELTAEGLSGEAGMGEEELGQGAPGADGSRRWRGRRGRRRGRGPAEPGSGTQAAAPEAGAEDRFDEEDIAESLTAGAAEPQPDQVEFTGEQRSRETGRERRESGLQPFGGQDRRREDRRREDRGGRSGENGRSRPSRFGTREDNYGEAGPEQSSRPAEPFILPGESLSRYRKGEEASRSAEPASARFAAPAITSRPSTEIELAGSWDGGATLPGETLSRYSKRSSRPETSEASAPAQQQTQAPDADNGELTARAGRDRRRERDLRRGRSRHEAGMSAAEAVQPGVASFHDPEETPLPLNVEGSPRGETPVDDITVAAFEEIETETPGQPDTAVSSSDTGNLAAQSYEPQTDLAPAATERVPAGVLEAVEEFHEVVADFEPGEDASASYRVDPAGPSEFRQSAPDAGTLVDVRFDEDDPVAQEGSHHEFTALQPSGEMVSEWPLTPEAETAQDEEASAETSPIVHESAVQSVTLDRAEAPAPAQPANDFHPGDGQLFEEELMDDDDGELPQLQASFADEETEEEAFHTSGDSVSELGADLGSIIREMSIDEITSAPAADEEDEDFDLDEDELEEDELAAGDEDASAAEFDSVPSRAGERTFDGSGEDAVDQFSEFGEFGAMTEEEAGQTEGGPGGSTLPAREGDRPVRREERRDERRDSRRNGRDRGRGDRRGMAGGRGSHHGNGRMSRHQAQTSDLPAISDLLKPGQEVLVQIAKEPIAKKGARITSHIALPGRFLVFMPTVQHVGVSRKIESDSERRRLKDILLSERGEASGDFIVRTAASGASEEELRSDLRFLLNLWADIKQRSESSKSPALIYHDLNLVERILRDQVTDTFSAIWVDTETEYERVLRFLQRFQPSLIRRVKLYTKDTPLFEQFGLSEEINKALRSKVWLKSGGSIVINQTEALVAIDINTGKYVGKTARLEDTIVKTNLDAIPEIVRQIRLRDLGGIIVIDFIDMDERRNRAKVLAALEEELKKDRAPSKVLQFNDFGLVAITRKRVKQSLERTLSQTCNTCAGTGMVKSPVTVCNEIFVEFRKMHRHLEKGDVMLRVNPEVVKQLKSNGGKWLQEMEEVAGKTILVKSDPSLHPEQFDIQ